MREFRLGTGAVVIGGGGLRDSTSSAGSGSTDSTGYGGESRGQRSGARSTSVDVGSDERSSWWRFSGGSNDFAHNSAQHHQDMREGHRRISVLRGPNGQINSSIIGRFVTPPPPPPFPLLSCELS